VIVELAGVALPATITVLHVIFLKKLLTVILFVLGVEFGFTSTMIKSEFDTVLVVGRLVIVAIILC
jgi:hypothetical protein